MPGVGTDTVFFLSDYGRLDEFVGVVHAVLRRLAPHVPVVDLTHDVPPFDVRWGAAALARAWPYLGEGVVLGVVDPDVGTPRRGVVLEVARGGPRWLVGPDNGLLLPAARLAGGVARAVALPPATSGRRHSDAAEPDPGRGAPEPATFDGRDVFAPAVAALCSGADPGDLGAPCDPGSLVQLADPVLEQGTAPDGRRVLRAEVTWVDRFGNVQLAAGGDALPAGLAAVRLAGPAPAGAPGDGPDGPDGPGAPPLRRVRTFADLSAGEAGLLADGNGHLALVAREASAAARFGLAAGALVELVW